jgi:hypothetical protein
MQSVTQCLKSSHLLGLLRLELELLVVADDLVATQLAPIYFCRW